jgi:roadblock/LC7 domain-containing protein
MSRDTNPRNYDLLAMAKLFAEEEGKISPDGEVLDYEAEVEAVDNSIISAMQDNLYQAHNKIMAAEHTITALRNKCNRMRWERLALYCLLFVLATWRLAR